MHLFFFTLYLFSGHYMQTFIVDPSKNEAVFQSPPLPISSAYCQLLWVHSCLCCAKMLTRPTLMWVRLKGCFCETYKYHYTTLAMFLVPKCLLHLLRTRFHFHMAAGGAGNLSVILQRGKDRKLLWSRSSSTSTDWVPEHLPLGKQDQSYMVRYSECLWDAVMQSTYHESDL